MDLAISGQEAFHRSIQRLAYLEALMPQRNASTIKITVKDVTKAHASEDPAVIFFIKSARD